MPKKYKGFDRSRHTEIGRELKATRDHLLHLFVEISNAYGTSHKATLRAERMFAQIDKLRDEMDNVVYREGTFQEQLSGDLREFYYPTEQASLHQSASE